MKSKLAGAVAVGILFLSACAEPLTGPPSAGDTDIAFTAGGAPFEPTGPQQPTIDLSRGPYVMYRPGEGQNLAQTFTPDRNMMLGYLELPVGCAAGTLLNIKIREGIGGTILEEFNYAGLPTAGTGSFELLQVYDPATSHGIKLRKRVTYAFELSAFYVGAFDPAHTCSIVPGPTGDSYSGGNGWYQLPVNGPDFLPLAADEDLPFITLVR